MNKPQKQVVLTLSRGARELLHHLKRLEGVQGPERSLVGESRSARKQDGAEERKEQSDCSEEGRRVEEIVEMAELHRRIEEDFEEARQRYEPAIAAKDGPLACILAGKMAGLSSVLHHIESMTEKRSDLFNARTLATQPAPQMPDSK